MWDRNIQPCMQIMLRKMWSRMWFFLIIEVLGSTWLHAHMHTQMKRSTIVQLMIFSSPEPKAVKVSL